MDERVDQRETRALNDPGAPMTRVTRRSRTRRLILPATVLILLAGGGVYLWTHQQRGSAPQAGAGPHGGMASAPQPVGAATIDKGDVRIILNELGTVTPLATVTVQSQISGYLTAVGFKEGQLVQKGDFLAQIDPRPYQVTLEQAQGTLAHDTGLLEQAKADLKRYQTLGRQDSIAQQQLEDQRFLVQQYTGTVQADQGSVDNAKLNLTYCHIVSPVTGQIGLRLIDPGNYVQTASSTGIAVVTQMQPISVLFTVPEDELGSIIQRLRGGATLPVDAYDRANTKKLESGTLVSLDNQIDTTTGTLRLRAQFDNPDEMLVPNQFVNARLLVDTMHDTVRVPVAAVQRGEPGAFVYVINQNDTVSVRPIKVGPTDGSYEAVLSGLEAGERVVTDGTDRLRDGAKVTLPQKTVANGTAAAGARDGTAASAAGDGTAAQAASGTAAGPNAASGHHRHGQAKAQ